MNGRYENVELPSDPCEKVMGEEDMKKKNLRENNNTGTMKNEEESRNGTGRISSTGNHGRGSTRSTVGGLLSDFWVRGRVM